MTSTMTHIRVRPAPENAEPARTIPAGPLPTAADLRRAGRRGDGERAGGARGAGERTRGAGNPAPRDANDLGDPTALCCSLVQAIVEALRGTRPLSQLARWATLGVYDQLTRRAELTARPPAGSAHVRARIRRARVCRIGPGVVEATVVVEDAARVRAAALRLEAHRSGWKLTAFELG